MFQSTAPLPVIPRSKTRQPDSTPVEELVLTSFSPILGLSMSELPAVGVGVPIPSFDARQVVDLCYAAMNHFRHQSSLLDLEPPIYIVGDLHGNLFDLLRILTHIVPLRDTHVLILGDYVDRGEYSIEVIVLLFALVLRYPDAVFMLRGNHEFHEINDRYGFRRDLIDVFRNEATNLFRAFNSSFDWLPVSALVGGDILCVRGGISPSIKSLADLRDIARPVSTCDDNFIGDLVWSDPTADGPGFLQTSRGRGFAFGVDAVAGFVGQLSLRHIVRAHQCVTDGVETFAKGVVYTVFSCSDYRDGSPNACGLLHVNIQGQIEQMSMPSGYKIPRLIARFKPTAAQETGDLVPPVRLHPRRIGSCEGGILLPLTTTGTKPFGKPACARRIVLKRLIAPSLSTPAPMGGGN
jgi:protein phosphatase